MAGTMVRISRNIVLSLILAALRGFCLLISEIHTVGISAKKSAPILYPALSCFDLPEIYELSGLGL
ncbi:MAG: hypothetical protein CVV37_07185 [Nitrospira bacterium HGW-Nitrospira-1]|nr:MAG: hypothetical protein CVV37_07185 [Nitrospira bacterium HGW-Nitrospira-1]